MSSKSNSQPNSSAEMQVPTALVKERLAGWNAFTKFIVINCVAIAGFLLLMLLFFKVIY